jgi:hypothetical protein
VSDQKPRKLTEEQKKALLVLSHQVVSQLELRRTLKIKAQAEQRLALLDQCVANLNDIVLITEAEPIDEPGPRILFANPAFERVTGYSVAESLGRSPRFLQGEKTDRTVLAEIRHGMMQKRAVRRQVVNSGTVRVNAPILSPFSVTSPKKEKPKNMFFHRLSFSIRRGMRLLFAISMEPLSFGIKGRNESMGGPAKKR